MGLFKSIGKALGGVLKAFNPFAPAEQRQSVSYGYFESPEQRALREQMLGWLQQQLPLTQQSVQQMGGYLGAMSPALSTALRQYESPFTTPEFSTAANTLASYLGNAFSTQVAPRLMSDAARAGLTGSSGAATAMSQAGMDYITTLGNMLSQLGLSQQALGASTANQAFRDLLAGQLARSEMAYGPLAQYLKVGSLLPTLQQTGATTKSYEGGSWGNLLGLGKILGGLF